MIADILKEPDDRLHTKAVPVGSITQEIQKLIDTMIETMHAADGVGLAANQIGSELAILVASPDGRRGEELTLINPKILKLEGSAPSQEGCLSLPGISDDVKRSARVTAEGLNRKGEKITLEADGLMAKILQHEVDHLEGHLFIDRVGLLQRKRLLRRYQNLSDSIREIDL